MEVAFPAAVLEAQPPLGYRFHPTDFELLDHYLRRLVHGHPLPMLYPRITRADVYADHPSAIWSLGDAHDETGNGSELHCYFFTELQSIGRGCRGKKMDRRVGEHGTWHMSGTRDIKVKNIDQVLGYNKYLNYRPSAIHRGDVEYEWGMHEFTLHDSTKYALCKITRRLRKKKLKGIEESIMLPNQQQQQDHIGFGENVLSSKHGNPSQQANLEICPESIPCSFNKVSAQAEVVTPSVASSSSSTSFPSVPQSHQQQLSGNTNHAHTATVQEPLSQFENSEFNAVLRETEAGQPQQPHMDHCEGSIVTTSFDTFELGDFQDIFLGLGDFMPLEDVRETGDYYQQTVGSIECQQNTCKRARVEEETGCVEHDQLIHDPGAEEAKKFRRC